MIFIIVFIVCCLAFSTYFGSSITDFIPIIMCVCIAIEASVAIYFLKKILKNPYLVSELVVSSISSCIAIASTVLVFISCLDNHNAGLSFLPMFAGPLVIAWLFGVLYLWLRVNDDMNARFFFISEILVAGIMFLIKFCF